jgi:splicing factor 45
MFSGLYGDLPEAKDESEKKQQPESTSAAATTPGTWSGSAMLIPTAKRPSAAAGMPPSSVLLRGGGKSRGGSNVATAARNGREKEKPSETTAAAISPSNPPAATASASFWGSNIVEEYDPNRPNDYDAICRRKEQLRLETVAEAERQERLREIKELEELEKIRERDTTSIMEVDFAPQKALGGGLGFSGNTNTTSVAGESAAVAAAGGPKGMTLAQRMLEKMGWKQGEGLGKSGQGIAAPLAVQKTDARSGRVGKYFCVFIFSLPLIIF